MVVGYAIVKGLGCCFLGEFKQRSGCGLFLAAVGWI
jgi:hypothetical protein